MVFLSRPRADLFLKCAVNAASLGADLNKGFIVGGTSAGGNIAATVAHLARDHGLPVTGCHLMAPAICDSAHLPERYRQETSSWQQNRNAAVLSRKAVKLFYDAYVPSQAERGNVLFSPLLWEGGHNGVCPTFFQVCGSDPLRDEALIYERTLREDEDVATKINVYPGLPHGFWSIYPTLNSSERFLDEALEGIQWLLT